MTENAGRSTREATWSDSARPSWPAPVRAMIVPIALVGLSCADPTSQTTGPGSVWWEMNWDFSTTQSMIAANTNQSSLGSVSLQMGPLFDGTMGKFMRATLRGDGSEDNTNFDLDIPGAGPGVTDEIWIEFYLRFDNNWRGTTDDKTFFVLPACCARWEIHYGSFVTRLYGGPSGAPQDFFIVSDDNNRLNIEDVWDGEWHRHRLYLRSSSAPGGRDGAFFWWFDDQELLSDRVAALYGRGTGENIDTGPTAGSYFTSIRLGANADPSGSGVRDWGRIRVYASDPRW